MILYKLQIFDDLLMMADPAYHMDCGKIFQPFAGKVRTLKTPVYLLLFGTAAKTVTAVDAAPIHVLREASVASYFLDGDTIHLGYLL